MEYQKIQSLFKRDNRHCIIPEQFTYPEFEALKNCRWECTEKIDGTNIRIELEFTGDDLVVVAFKGRTDRAQVPAHLMNRLEELFGPIDWRSIFPDMTGGHVTLYGEGYGVKIQSGGNYIKDGVDFILFDVKVDKWWLERDAIEDIAGKLNIKVVPLMGYMTIPEAIDFVRKGFKSTIAENKDYNAEGLVLKAPYGLLRRNGERLITKIKTVDFKELERKGRYEAVETKRVPEGS